MRKNGRRLSKSARLRALADGRIDHGIRRQVVLKRCRVIKVPFVSLQRHFRRRRENHKAVQTRTNELTRGDKLFRFIGVTRPDDRSEFICQMGRPLREARPGFGALIVARLVGACDIYARGRTERIVDINHRESLQEVIHIHSADDVFEDITIRRNQANFLQELRALLRVFLIEKIRGKSVTVHGSETLIG